MNDELENLILTIDTHEEANKEEKTRIKSITEWFIFNGGSEVYHEELGLCDYEFLGKFRGNPINLRIEYKTWDNFLTDSIDDMEDKLKRSKEICDTVALFIETGNYTFKPNLNNNHCILDYSGFVKNSMKQNGNLEPQSKTLAAFEGFCDTLQSNEIHVRQLRGEAQFPYSVYNLLVYLTTSHRLKVKTMTYESWLLNHYMDLPTVGIVKAKNLILRYPNPFWIGSASEESLVAVLGAVTGRVVYQHLRSHDLETEAWRNNYFKDGTNIRQCPTTHKPCDQVNAYDCTGAVCEHHPDYSKYDDKIKSAIVDYLTEEYPHALSVDKLCDHFNIEQGDEDKERFLIHLKELAWEKKITNTISGEFQVVVHHKPSQSLSNRRINKDSELKNDDIMKESMSVTHDTLQSHCDPAGTFIKQISPTTPKITHPADDNDKSTEVLPPNLSSVPFSNQKKIASQVKSLPSSALTSDKDKVIYIKGDKISMSRVITQGRLDAECIGENRFDTTENDEALFGKPHPDWTPVTPEELALRRAETKKFEEWESKNKMNARGLLEKYLQNPHTLQECVDAHSNFAKGTIWEHIARMKREGVVVEFDNKTLVMTGSGK